VGARTVRLRVRDNVGLATTVTKQVTVVEAGKPVAFFSFAPDKPATMDEIVFTAAVNDDPGAVAVRHEWDFDGNGTVDADTAERRVAHWTYGHPGTHPVKLRVSDADGDQTEHTVNVNVVRATQCGRPFGVGIDGELGPAFVEVTATGYLSVYPPGINLEGRGRAGFRGIGVCGEFDTFLGKVRPGVTFQFAEDILEPRLEDLDRNVFVKGCDHGPIRVFRSARIAAADGARVVEMPARLPSASVQVTGADGPPKVTLVAPNAERIDTPADDSGRKAGRFILVQDARSRTTTIVVVKPPAGDWRVEGRGRPVGARRRRVDRARPPQHRRHARARGVEPPRRVLRGRRGRAHHGPRPRGAGPGRPAARAASCSSRSASSPRRPATAFTANEPACS
jgi:PKD repeat protein